MDNYDPATVFSSIDERGRYAYGNQPQIGLWNLTRLAETLLPLLDDDQDRAVAKAEEALIAYRGLFEQSYDPGLSRKFGLTARRDGDDELESEILTAMKQNQVDFTLFFRRLADVQDENSNAEPLRSLFVDPTRADAWLGRWRQRLAEEPQDAAERRAAMRAVNPAYIPRNHRVEAIIRAAVDDDDFAPFEELVTVLSHPFDDQPEFARYAEPPQDHERVLQTFCGT
jgi:uncharacterized protein YdiU (UPF0061 family)